MIKTSPLLFWFSLILTTSVALYNISDRAHALGEQLRSLNAQIEQEQTNIHVLKAEWAFLASPEKIQAAAAKHLKLQPTAVKQVAALNELPEVLPTRAEAMASVIVAHTPIASIASLPAMATHGREKMAAADKSHVNIRMIIQQVATAQPTTAESRIQLADFGAHR